MTLDDIEPDKTLVLTKEMARIFRIADCEPGCHVCYKLIEVGDKFKLATYDKQDTMLCDKCTVADLIKQEEEEAERLKESLWRGRGTGYSRPTKV